MGSSSGRKRKRVSNGGDARGTPSKRRRSNNGQKQAATESSRPSKLSLAKLALSAKPSTSSSDAPHKQRKHKPRCHKLCSDAVDKITRALRSSPCPIGHLFTAADEDGMPFALLSEIAKIIDLPPQLLTLPADKLPLMSGDVYQMGVNDTGQFIVKYAPVEFSIEAATVYLDRLPYPCSRWLLGKLCARFGTVVDARIPLRTPAPLKSARRPTVINKRPSQHRGFAFVQFSTEQEAAAICQEFALNHPDAPHSRNRWFFNRGRRRHLGQHTTKLGALTELRHARMMRLKLKLEKSLRRKLKLRQWKKEYKENRRAAIRARRKRRRELLKKRRREMKKRDRGEKRKDGERKKEKREKKETPKKSKDEKRKEANRKKRKRRSDLKKEAKKLLSQGGRGAENNTESDTVTSEAEGSEERRKESTANGLPSSDSNEKEEQKMEMDEKVEEETKPVEKEEERQRKRRCRRKEIRKSIRSHFIDVQAMPFREYERMRADYLRLRAEAEATDADELAAFKARNSNHKREEYREAMWTVREEGEGSRSD